MAFRDLRVRGCWPGEKLILGSQSADPGVEAREFLLPCTLSGKKRIQGHAPKIGTSFFFVAFVTFCDSLINDTRREYLRVIKLRLDFPDDADIKELFKDAFEYPDDLPDLKSLRPPRGNRPKPGLPGRLRTRTPDRTLAQPNLVWKLPPFLRQDCPQRYLPARRASWSPELFGPQ